MLYVGGDGLALRPSRLEGPAPVGRDLVCRRGRRRQTTRCMDPPDPVRAKRRRGSRHRVGGLVRWHHDACRQALHPHRAGQDRRWRRADPDRRLPHRTQWRDRQARCDDMGPRVDRWPCRRARDAVMVAGADPRAPDRTRCGRHGIADDRWCRAADHGQGDRDALVGQAARADASLDLGAMARAWLARGHGCFAARSIRARHVIASPRGHVGLGGPRPAGDVGASARPRHRDDRGSAPPGARTRVGRAKRDGRLRLSRHR